MAKKKAGQFFVEVLSSEQAKAEMSKAVNRAFSSKYDSIGRAAESRLTGDNALRVRLEKKDVQALRTFLQKKFQDKYTLKAAATGKGDVFAGFIFLGSA